MQCNLFRTNTKGPMIFVCNNGSSSYPYGLPSEYTVTYPMELRILVLLNFTFHTVDGDASVQNGCNSSVNRRRRRAPTTPDSYLEIFSISNTALPMITHRMPIAHSGELMRDIIIMSLMSSPERTFFMIMSSIL